MIGVIKCEESLVFEFQPRFGGPYFKWLQVPIPNVFRSLGEGEYGVSFSLGKGWKCWTLWVHKGSGVEVWDLRRIANWVRQLWR